MKIKIDAIDTLFFKDGKPFAMGEENWANGIFPPAPSVFYGALRTLYFSKHLDLLSKANKDDDPTLNLKIKGIYFFIDDNLFLPAPADLVTDVQKIDDDTLPLYKLSLTDKPAISNYQLDRFLFNSTNLKVEKPQEDVLLGLSYFNSYLSGDFNKLPAVKLSKYITIEPKIGIGRSNITKSAAESMLYRVGMRRLEKNGLKISFVIDFNGLDVESKGLLKLGGEGKAACFKSIVDELSISKPQLTSNIVKLYLLTPSIFKNGSLPDLEKPLFKKYNMKLIAAAVPGFKSIGGFDMESNKPKPMYRAVKEGSVYYFTYEGDAQTLVDDFYLNSISDYNLDKLGFGITLAGNVI
ncbi:type III-B CRISPR module-associated protein Cmr3 [Rosettibacter firmus]|uniref:type III-B CRISPR module-associated protein Cmr3 n=1 Tax=Rosettibacter firmus TaxID=3111522 RepID=UPI00336BE7DE